MCERNMDRVPFTHPQLGTKPTTLTHTLTGHQTGDAQPTEPHGSGLFDAISNGIVSLVSFSDNSLLVYKMQPIPGHLFCILLLY